MSTADVTKYCRAHNNQWCCLHWLRQIPNSKPMPRSIYDIYIYAFSRRFYPKWLTVHSGYTFFVSMCSLGIEPTTFALLTQCSNHWATGTLNYIAVTYRHIVQMICHGHFVQSSVDRLLGYLLPFFVLHFFICLFLASRNYEWFKLWIQNVVAI